MPPSTDPTERMWKCGLVGLRWCWWGWEGVGGEEEGGMGDECV